jgi:glutamyl/glutaminyl-tRNA synthetase
VPLVKDRLVKLSDFPALTNFFYSPPQIDKSLFTDPTLSLSHLTSALHRLSAIDKWSKDAIEIGWVDEIKVSGWKVGDYFMSVRIALCGSRQTPPTTDTMLVLGKEEVLSRLNHSINLITRLT